MINKILITGGAGYIGNKLIQSLPDTSEVIIVDNFHINTSYKQTVNEQLKNSRKVTLIKANVSDVEKYKDTLMDVDVVLYMASLNSWQESNLNPLHYLRENNINLQVFVVALKKYSTKLKKIILTSTRSVYGEGTYICNSCHKRFCPTLSESLKCNFCKNDDISPRKIKETDRPNPSSYYGLTKKIQEDLLKMFCLQNNIALDIFRIFNVYGEGQGKYYSNIGVIPQMFEQIKNNKEIYMSGNGEITRDYVYIGDIVNILLRSIFNSKSKTDIEVYNLGSGQGVSINNLSQYFEGLGYNFDKKKLKHYGDIKYSVAENSKLMKNFNIKKFMDLYTFLSKNYK